MTHVEEDEKEEVAESSEEDHSSDESESDEGEKEYRAELEEGDSEDDELASLMGGGGGGWQLASRAATLPKREVKVWNVGTVGQRKKNAIPPKPEGATRFVCISDTHNRHRMLELPAGDVLLHSGDFSLSCKEKELVDFTEWLHEQPYTHKVIVAGNHDVLLHSEFYERHHWRYHTEKIERHLELKQRLRSVCTYLEDELCEINGIKIWGSPWVPYYHDWAFMPPDDAGLKAAWAKVPAGVDVLITHGPPHKVRDKTYQGANAGCPLLADAVFKRIKPAVHCFGHIHTGYGVVKQRDSTFINAAIVNSVYKVANNAVVFDIK
ncbi:Ser/Thr phosphatase family superfamily protein [Acanthamoeba castellanii str. Neff]|uniref:Ser/Thr phosphatase family superfamily protein n=1 Tax=Acanthamoeba castellanii (strain ATCC 30010 / Neff) TaxID=1257118 RepID=L8GEC8_ACACF|nr:Ser/Thr phosphatase family superfamily protein [Acanthamoeba castellanii str. Neff]ELR11455.1 Ser/Thr phosphatase family superfamily protein [Acanthamoeba castellanii str. Neff]